MGNRSVKIDLTARVDGYVNGMKTAKAATEDFARNSNNSFKKNRESLEQLTGVATKMGVGLTVAAGFAVKSAMDWEVAWTGVLKTVDGTPQMLAKVEDGLRGLAKETGFAHAEVAAVAEAAGQLGISTQGVVDFTETMLAMGVSTNLSAEEAATGFARFRNIMGSSEADISKMGSTIVGLGNNFATTEREILEMSLRLAGAGRQAGFTESDVMALATSMSSVGIEAEAGGTAMSLTMQRIGKAVDSGGTNLKKFSGIAANSGKIAARDFAKAWEDDAAGALLLFIEGLKNSADAGVSLNQMLDDLGIKGIREADAIRRLTGNVKGLDEALGMSAEEWARNAALMEEANKFYDTTAQIGEQALASIKDSAIRAGDAILPAVAGAFEAVGGLADAFGALPGPVKTGLTAVAGTAGVSMLAFTGAVKLTGAIHDAKAAYDALSVSGGRAGKMAAATAKGFAAAAAIYGTIELVDKFDDRGAKGMSKLTKELEKFGKTGKAVGDLEKLFGDDLHGRAVRFNHDMDSIGEAIKRQSKWGDDSSITKIGKFFATAGQSGSVMTKQAEGIRDMDNALVSLARNKPDDALKTFDEIIKAAKDTGASADDIALAFPQMTETVRAASEAAGESSDAITALEGDLAGLGPELQAAAEHLAKVREAALAVADSFLEPGKALEGSVSDWKAQLEEQTRALRNFRENAVKLLSEGVDSGLVDELLAGGPDSAPMMQKLVDAAPKVRDELVKTWQAGTSEADRYADAISGIEKITVSGGLVTEFKTKGANGAIETAARVAKQYDLTPDEVTAILDAKDYTADDIKKVRARLADLNGVKAEPTISVRTVNTQAIQAVRDAVNSLPRSWTTTINIKGGRTTSNADGGFYNGNVRAFADGGVDEYGRRVERVSQMRSGTKGTVMWGEQETGWEAYVSGKPSQKGRNRAVLNEAATRLGGTVSWFADGGFTETEAVSSLELTRMKIRVRDLNRALKKKEKYGKDKKKERYVLRGLDRREAKQELKEAKAELAEQLKIRKKIGKGKKYKTAGQYNREMKKREKKAEERESKAEEQKAEQKRIAEEAKRNREDTAKNFSSNFDTSNAFKSPAALERALATKLRESAEFTQVLAQLKAAGASPWLLDQLVQAGPSRATIRTARALLTDTGRLARLNAMSSSLTTVANQYAAITTNPKFTQAAAANLNSAANMAELQRLLSQWTPVLTINGRQAGVLVQAGQTHAGGHA